MTSIFVDLHGTIGLNTYTIGISQLKIVKTCTMHFVDRSKRMLSQMAETTRDVKEFGIILCYSCVDNWRLHKDKVCVLYHLSLLSFTKKQTLPLQKGFAGVKL